MKRAITPDSITPVSTQLRMLLLREIQEGRLTPGSRIPSERDLADRYHVSRTSVRDCIARLMTEKVLARSTRRGTFVAEPPAAAAPVRTRSVGYLVSKGLLEFFHTRHSRILSGAEEW